MQTEKVALPRVVSREEWVAERKALLQKEKEITRALDAVNAQRRRLPMVEVDKDYKFEGPDGKQKLIDLFQGRRQLIVYHFMFDPNDPPPGKHEPYDEGCSGCSHVADNIGHLAHINDRDVTFVMVSRAPLSKITPFKQRMGWNLPWVSSFGSDFNYDFRVTVDPSKGSAEYNYMPMDKATGEQPGLSVFLRDGDKVYHTYSTYARGLDYLLCTYHLLDLTPYGRQEEWEDSPEGWPQGPTFRLRHHDKYGEAEAKPCCGGD